MAFRGAALLGLLLAFTPGARGEWRSAPSGAPGAGSQPSSKSPGGSPASFRIPPAFEPNRGQADPSVSFVAKGKGALLFLRGTDAVLALPRPGAAGRGTVGPLSSGQDPMQVPVDLLKMRFPGARAAAFRGGAPLPGVSHYLIGKDESRWVRDVPRCVGASCTGLWPGVDLRWEVHRDGALEYSFLLAPGADAGVLAIDFEGQESMAVEPGGDLVLRTAGGPVRHTRPRAWQESGGVRRPVAARFALGGGGRASIELGPVDPALPVVVDPKILASTYFGGSGLDIGCAVAVDGQGRPVIAGYTYSTNLPVANAFQSTIPAATAVAFVSRLSADGASLVSSTYLGGSNGSQAFAVALDATGAMYVGGTTSSYSFPVKNAFQAELDYYDNDGNGTNNDAFVTKLASTGSSLVWSTYLGSGGSPDSVLAMAVTSTGEVVVGGETQGKEFPTTSGQKGFTGSNFNYSGFLTKFTATGTTLAWSTYVGGAATDIVTAVSVGPDDSVCLAGYTESTGLATAGAYQATHGGARDCMVGRMAANGSAYAWFTYLGSSSHDDGLAVAAAGDGGAFVVGTTSSPGFPVQNPIFGTHSGNADAFVARIGPTGSTLAFSTFLGGSGIDTGNAVVLAADGSLWVAGSTTSANFPVDHAVQAVPGGGIDGFVAIVLPDGPALRSSTFLGGSGEDIPYGIASAEPNTAWIGGRTRSPNFPFVAGYDSTVADYDAFLTAISNGPRSPSDMTAELYGLTEIAVAWTDRSDDETGFAVERKPGVAEGSEPYEPLAVLPAGTVFLLDQGLDPDTPYTYRVKATGTLEDSAWTVSNSVTTPPEPVYPPDAPSGIAAEVVSSRRIDLTWSDNSDDEDFFSLARAAGTGLFSTLATPNLGKTAYTDATVLPEQTYSWKIRAQNPLGFSLFSNTVTVTLPPTLEVSVTKGKVVHKAGLIGRDSVALDGSFTYGTEAQHAVFDPSNQSLVLRIGTVADPPILTIPVPADGWAFKKGKYTWKSPKGSTTKAKVTVDPSAFTFTVKLTKLTVDGPTTNPLRVTLSLGTDTGHADEDWTPPTKSGVLKFPVPVPK